MNVEPVPSVSGKVVDFKKIPSHSLHSAPKHITETSVQLCELDPHCGLETGACPKTCAPSPQLLSRYYAQPNQTKHQLTMMAYHQPYSPTSDSFDFDQFLNTENADPAVGMPISSSATAGFVFGDSAPTPSPALDEFDVCNGSGLSRDSMDALIAGAGALPISPAPEGALTAPPASDEPMILASSETAYEWLNAVGLSSSDSATPDGQQQQQQQEEDDFAENPDMAVDVAATSGTPLPLFADLAEFNFNAESKGAASALSQPSVVTAVPPPPPAISLADLIMSGSLQPPVSLLPPPNPTTATASQSSAFFKKEDIDYESRHSVSPMSDDDDSSTFRTGTSGRPARKKRSTAKAMEAAASAAAISSALHSSSSSAASSSHQPVATKRTAAKRKVKKEEDDMMFDDMLGFGADDTSEFIVPIPPRPLDPELAREYERLKDPSLSSKDRRQLRNKLSARSFRERRKDYIDALENEVRHLRKEVQDSKRDYNGVSAERDELRTLVEELTARLQKWEGITSSSASSVTVAPSASAATPVDGVSVASASQALSNFSPISSQRLTTGESTQLASPSAAVGASMNMPLAAPRLPRLAPFQVAHRSPLTVHTVTSIATRTALRPQRNSSDAVVGSVTQKLDDDAISSKLAILLSFLKSSTFKNKFGGGTGLDASAARDALALPPSPTPEPSALIEIRDNDDDCIVNAVPATPPLSPGRLVRPPTPIDAEHFDDDFENEQNIVQQTGAAVVDVTVGRRLLTAARMAKKVGDLSLLINAVVREVFAGIVNIPPPPATSGAASKIFCAGDVDFMVSRALRAGEAVGMRDVLDPNVVKVFIIFLLSSA